MEEEFPNVTKDILIRGDINRIYKVLSVMTFYPNFMKDVLSVTVVEDSVNADGLRQTITDWETDVENTPIFWKERDTFFPTLYRIVWELLEGDLDKFDGFWQLTQLADGMVKVDLSVTYDFGIPNLTELIGPTLKEKVGENSDMMLKGLKAFIESDGLLPEEMPLAEEEAVAVVETPVVAPTAHCGREDEDDSLMGPEDIKRKEDREAGLTVDEDDEAWLASSSSSRENISPDAPAPAD